MYQDHYNVEVLNRLQISLTTTDITQRHVGCDRRDWLPIKGLETHERGELARKSSESGATGRAQDSSTSSPSHPSSRKTETITWAVA
jgi:hypothetical protein